jgi:hypothetical protein
LFVIFVGFFFVFNFIFGLGWGDAGAEGLSGVFFVLLFILVLAVFL